MLVEECKIMSSISPFYPIPLLSARPWFYVPFRDYAHRCFPEVYSPPDFLINVIDASSTQRGPILQHESVASVLAWFFSLSDPGYLIDESFLIVEL